MRLRPLVAAAALPLAGSAIIALATPASAAFSASFTSPGNATTNVTQNGSITVAWTFDVGATGSVTITCPGHAAKTIYTTPDAFGHSSQTVLRTNTSTSSASLCGFTGYAPNGSYVFQLLDSNGSRVDARTINLKVPGRAAQDLSASNVDTQTVRLAWSEGTEPDLLGYSVLNPDNGQSYITDANGQPSALSLDNACTSGSCSLTLAFSPTSSTTYKFIVESIRNCPSCSSGEVTSAASNTASATVAPPPPSPTPTTSGGGGGGTSSGSPSPWPSGSGGSNGGISYTGGRNSSGKPAVVFHVGAGAPAVSGIALPGGDQLGGSVPTPFGTYNPVLPYPSTTSVEEPVVSGTKDPGTLHTISSALGSPVTKGHLSRSIAAALVLLVMAAHIWVWAAAPSRE